MASSGFFSFPTLVDGENPLVKARLRDEEEQQRHQQHQQQHQQRHGRHQRDSRNPQQRRALHASFSSCSSSSSSSSRATDSTESLFHFEMMDPPARSPAGADVGGPAFEIAKKTKKRKVLLMGKSGSGKSSMRSIIFSNYLAVDTRRLGATIDVDLSHVKFLGNLTLNLWDCGGQEAFMENYINQQRAHVFSYVGVLIYVFDIESRDVDRDLATYVSIVSALAQYSPSAKVFVLVHKMDLIMHNMKESVFNERVRLVRTKTAEAVQNTAAMSQAASAAAAAAASPGAAAAAAAPRIDIQPFATSIWDQSLYKAWSSIIHDLIPNLAVIERELGALGQAIEAEEIFLYERTSFLVVSTWKSDEAARNPHRDREERLSNVMKTFKNRLAGWSGTSRNSDQFKEFQLTLGTLFSFAIMTFTTNTYIQLVLPPGEARLNAAKLNTRIAAAHFERLDSPPAKDMAKAAGSSAAAATAAAATRGFAAAVGALDISGDEQQQQQQQQQGHLYGTDGEPNPRGGGGGRHHSTAPAA